MDIRQVLGILLSIGVVGLFLVWLRFQRKQEAAEMHGGVQEVTILVKGAYDPNVVTVKAGIPVKLHFNRQEDADCSRFVTFEGMKLRKDLKAFDITDVEFTPEKFGEIPFTCDMGMYQGKVVVE